MSTETVTAPKVADPVVGSIPTPAAPAKETEKIVAPAAKETPKAAQETPKPTEEKKPKGALGKVASVLSDEPAKTEEAKVAPAEADAFDLKLPEGSLLPKERAAKLAALAKERGWTKEQAQATLESEDEAVLSHVEGMMATHAKQVEKWGQQLMADPEVGGDPVRFKESAMLVKNLLQKEAPELLKELDDTGLGNSPRLFKFIAKMARKSDNDKLITTAGSSGATPPVKSEEEFLKEFFTPEGEKK